jgi:hypothetical protein
MSMKRQTLNFAILAFSAAACESATEPTVRQLGWIGPVSSRAIGAPDTVRVGVPFQATVYTWGSGTVGCNAPDGTSLETVGQVVRIEVFVRVPGGESVCTSDLRRYGQQVTATFRTPGVAIIRAVGAATSWGPVPAVDSTERSIVVVP